MNKKLALLALPAALLLGGCISTSKPVQIEHYTITAAQASAQTAPATSQTAAHKPVLRIAGIEAPHWLDSASMYYRLAYQNSAKVAAYSRSDWVSPPPVQILSLLEDVLAASGNYKAVLGPSDISNADVTLRIELGDFEQVFTSQNQSAGVLDATVTVVDNRAGKIAAQRHFHIEKPAPSADAAGGVKALGEASQAFATEVRDWLGQLTLAAKAGTARSPGAAG
ncbi:MAG TPA: ABC-type transport auxiliary lipoprotein family protein [Gammaproteobacteria bacterium]|nr:ABC-type transport auxiliary lipoprotein family protein [Gammaproteobacteria bacterium]